MRLLLALALFLPLSGCLTDSPADDAAGASDDAAFDPVPRKGVVFFQAPYQAVPQQATEFQVDVPVGAQNVVFEISQQAHAGTAGTVAEVALVECGTGTADWYAGANIAIIVGSSWRDGVLCSLPAAGMQTLTIDASLTPLVGTILLRADLPAN